MFCKNCNVSIPETAAFCPLCGAETGVEAVEKAATRKCPQCGAENPLEAKFCRIDGWNFTVAEAKVKPAPEKESPGEKRCPTCGSLNPATARFCRKDGTVLDTDRETPETVVKPEADVREEVAGPQTAAELPQEEVVAPSRLGGMEEATLPTPGQALPTPGQAQAPLIEKEGRGSKRLLIYLAFALIVIALFGAGAAYWIFLKITSTETPQPGIESTVEAPPVEEVPQAKVPETPAGQKGQAVDLPRLEGQINRALRAAGLNGVTAVVDDSAVVTLKGVVKDPRDKKKALEKAQSFQGVSKVKDVIFVIER